MCDSYEARLLELLDSSTRKGSNKPTGPQAISLHLACAAGTKGSNLNIGHLSGA
jgi:hypothetical protein